ncbi:hypothetical protein [Pseudomonas sp. NA-150]
MTRRIALLIALGSIMLSLNGCFFYDGHRHCCWRYDAVEHGPVR